MEQESAFFFMYDGTDCPSCEKMKLEGLQSGGHRAAK